jgi:N-acetyl-gamma-glutamylphosphate reductase
VAAAVMMLVFAHTGGLTGAEVAVAGGAGAVGHALLEALLGDQAIRTLAAKARSSLESRVAELYAEEAQRYEAALASLDVDTQTPVRLRRLAESLSRAVVPAGTSAPAAPTAPAAAPGSTLDPDDSGGEP